MLALTGFFLTCTPPSLTRLPHTYLHTTTPSFTPLPSLLLTAFSFSAPCGFASPASLTAACLFYFCLCYWDPLPPSLLLPLYLLLHTYLPTTPAHLPRSPHALPLAFSHTPHTTAFILTPLPLFASPHTTCLYHLLSSAHCLWTGTLAFLVLVWLTTCLYHCTAPFPTSLFFCIIITLACLLPLFCIFSSLSIFLSPLFSTINSLTFSFFWFLTCCSRHFYTPFLCMHRPALWPAFATAHT